MCFCLLGPPHTHPKCGCYFLQLLPWQGNGPVQKRGLWATELYLSQAQNEASFKGTVNLSGLPCPWGCAG